MHGSAPNPPFFQGLDMSDSEKKLSRREFLRIAGLAGAAGATLSVDKLIQPQTKNFRPYPKKLDEAAGRPARPWWVRRVEQPTVEIDWERIQRMDYSRTVLGGGLAHYVGETEVVRISQLAQENQRKRILDNEPGYTLKDYALSAAQQFDTRKSLSFLGPQTAFTPEARNVPPWQGSPEEAARILRVAMRHFGAATIAFVELNENTRKLIYKTDPDGKELVFEDVDAAYETETKRVIPEKARWVIVYTVQMSQETMKRAPTVTASQTTSLAYNRGAHIQCRTQEFLRGLGYQALGQATLNGLAIAPAFAVLGGLGELSRLNRVITPEFGPMVRIFTMITDLPLAVDQPIDAGIIEFCKVCKKCAEACPPGALSLDDHPSWEVQGEWNNPGHKTYFEDSVKCLTYWQTEAGTNCGICFAVCPFSKKDKAWLHQCVKATISTLPVMNGFLRSMDDAFSYGAQKDPDLWWELDLPEYGIASDTAIEE